MKNLKLFVLAVAAATALMAFAGAGSASATFLTCGSGTQCAEQTAIKATAEGKVVLDAPFGNIECELTVEGTTENSTGKTTVTAPLSTFTLSNCGGDTVTTLEKGSLLIESAGSSNGILRSTGTKVTMTHVGIHCIYETNNTSLGTLTGSSTTGGNATLDISATIPRVGGTGGSFCGTSAPWTGSLKFTTPSSLNIDEGEGTGEARLVGKQITGIIGEALTITWENRGEASAVIDDEVNSSETVAETLGLSCGTIAATSSCTSRKIKCLKEGETTLTVRDTPSVEGKLAIKCDQALSGGPTTATVGETVPVTWKNNTENSINIEDEATSDGTIAETLGTGCGGTLAATSSCASRKIKCLKAGEATITAKDTPSIEGKFVIKCD
ncbi:MAG: hypothetical protein ACTHK6_07610 [Solirubrobacterales bacterium]